MEMSVLMLITASGIKSGLHDMANGANMSFSKKAFLEVNGYAGNYQYSSGDDMFLIDKMRSAFPERISFIKSREAIVETQPHHNWNSLIQQRLRWAVKNKGLKSPVIRIIWSFVGLYHVLIVITLVFTLFYFSSWWAFIVLVVVKWICDGMIIYHSSIFLRNNSRTLDFVLLQLMYSFYIIRIGWAKIIRSKPDWE